MPGLDIDLTEALAKTDEKLKEAGIDPNASAPDQEETGEPMNPESDDQESKGDEEKVEEENKGDEEKVEDGEEKVEEKPPVKDDGAVVFKDASELAKFVNEQIETINKTSTTKKDKSEAEENLDKVAKFFDDEWKPKNWNEAVSAIAPHLKKIFQEEADKAKADSEQKTVELNKRLDSEYDALVSGKKIPARDTEDGKRVNRELAAVGAAYGLGSYKVAYDIWSKLPKGTEIVLPNGDKAKVGMIDSTPEKKPNPSKIASAKISGNQPSSSTADDKKIKYADIHGVPMDRLLERAGAK